MVGALSLPSNSDACQGHVHAVARGGQLRSVTKDVQRRACSGGCAAERVQLSGCSGGGAAEGVRRAHEGREGKRARRARRARQARRAQRAR